MKTTYKFHSKIESIGGCEIREGLYDIYNLPYNSVYLVSNNTENSISPELKSFITDTIYSDKFNITQNIITIYPNPTKGIVYIQSDNNISFRIELTNLLGENIFISDVVICNVKVDLTDYVKGIYFIKVYDNNELIKTDKIVYE